ncbi:MAG TPA: ABC transporter permease, partial [Thermaerobacter sp.]
ILFFAVRLGWLPASGYVPLTVDPVQNLKTMLLPIVVTGLRESAVLMRMMRSSLLEVLRLDYVRTARAKGLGGWAVIVRHAARTALVPVLTVSGLQLAGLLGGLVITEQIFVIPGFGRLIVDSILNRDLITLKGAVLVAATMVVAVNFLVDVLYAWLDPRIKVTGGARA